jgi:hypothetical protein
MLGAAVAYLNDGPEAFGAVRDPFGDGPFRFEERGAAFDLVSALPPQNNVAARLTIGKPPR